MAWRRLLASEWAGNRCLICCDGRSALINIHRFTISCSTFEWGWATVQLWCDCSRRWSVY
jgi:hypothetical protein